MEKIDKIQEIVKKEVVVVAEIVIDIENKDILQEIIEVGNEKMIKEKYKSDWKPI